MKLVTIVIYGKEETHLPPGNILDYDTLCGVDCNDPKIGHQGTVKTKPGAKVTCYECYAIWKAVSQLNARESDFSVGKRGAAEQEGGEG